MMSSYLKVFENVRKYPGMCLLDGRYESACAFVTGVDMACSGEPLRGFNEWLALRAGGRWNLSWMGLVLYEAFPDADFIDLDGPSRRPRTDAEHTIAFEKLFELISEFVQDRARPDGLLEILSEYAKRRDASTDEDDDRPT
jgi:hypothetical protein